MTSASSKKNQAPESVPFLRDSAPDRTEIRACGIKLDISRQRISAADFEGLLKFVEKKGLLEAHRAMVQGATVNQGEHRQALHTSLRAFSAEAPRYDEVLA